MESKPLLPAPQDRPEPTPRELKKELREWIDAELSIYVKDMICDEDYARVRKNLFDIATAYGENLKALEVAAPARAHQDKENDKEA